MKFYPALVRVLFVFFLVVSGPLAAEDAESQAVLKEVSVEPRAEDEAISKRLEKILIATGWFDGTQVKVEEGIVFISGRTTTSEYRTWAGDLARNTEGVVAVVNGLKVAQSTLWGVEVLTNELIELFDAFIRGLPVIVVIFLLLCLTYA